MLYVFRLLYQLPCSSWFPYLFLSLGLPIPRDTVMLKLGQLITLQCPLSVQVKEKVALLSFEIKS